MICGKARRSAEDFSLMVECGGDGSTRMALEGVDPTHYQGHSVSFVYLERLKVLALEELGARPGKIAAELAATGVETDE